MGISLYSRKGNLKIIIFLSGIILIISGIWYSQRLVEVLKEQATDYTNFRIRVFEENINNPSSDTDSNFLFNEVIMGIDYPVIVTSPAHNPLSWKNISEKIDNKSTDQLTSADSLILAEALSEMMKENDPIPIMYQDSIVINYYYYGYSPVIYKLRLFPYIAISAAAVFILIGYLGFSYIRKNEQRFVWVGMAKETAHQLGTPLSSLSGWMELLDENDGMKDTALREMKNDFERLKKIANRFSKIGSKPELKPVRLSEVITGVVSYFQKRLPNLQKKVDIRVTGDPGIVVNLNYDLFEWVLENLIKNALDAVKDKKGLIKIDVKMNSERSLAYIDISDNGKGIAAKEKKNVFKPGYSTKKRGWGLGLSLTRRIIEEYHGGKIYVKESRPGTGTVFRIILKV